MAEFVSGSFDSVVFWEAKTFSKKRTEKPFINSACHLSSLTWSSSNAKLAVVPRQGDRVALCEFHEGAIAWTFLSHQVAGSKFCSGCLLHNSRYLASGSEDALVHIWDLKNKKIYKTFPGHTSPVTSIAHNHSDHWMISGGRDGAIILHSVDGSTPKQFFQGPSDQPNMGITRLCFSHVEKGQFASVGEDGVACVWSVESQRLLSKYSSPHTGPATDLCFSPSNNMLMISVGMDSRIKCYDIQTRKTVTEVSAPSPLSSVTMLKDGSTLLAGGADGKLYVYELRTVKYPKTTLAGHETAITCIAHQSYSRYSSRSKSSRSSSSSKGKHMPDGVAENSIHLGSANSSPANHLLLDGASPAVSPDVRTEPPSTTQPSSRSSSSSHKQDSMNITPFVTQTTARTDGGVKQLSSGGEGLSTGAATVFATPASTRAQTSSIFSPLDPNLVTPLPGFRATVPGASLITPAASVITPTQPASSTPSTDTQIPSMATPTQPASSTPSSSTDTQIPSIVTPTQPASSLPAGSHIPSATRSHPAPLASETSGIFSPLDSGASLTRLASAVSRQPVASPLLIAHTQVERKVLPGGEVLGAQHRAKSKVSNGGRGVESDATMPSGMQDENDSRVGGVKSKTLIPTTGQSQLADMLERQSLETPSQPSNPALSSTHSMFSQPDSATSSSADILGSVDNNNTDVTEHRTLVMAPPPSDAPPTSNDIQMKYLEAMIKDAHEETCQALHQDIRALSVDNIKFFCSLQQQSASQHAALMEKMDRLNEELRRVQEMVHQYMPKH